MKPAPRIARKVGPAGSRRGVAILLLSVIIAVLLGFVGLAIDVGHLQYIQQRAQTAADTAALAAMQELEKGRSESEAEAAALADAAMNGFSHGEGGVTVAVNWPPTSGPMAGQNSAVETIIRKNNTNFFLGFVGHERASVSARAVSTVGSNGVCLYALNPNAYQAFKVTGGNQTYLQCGIMVKSSNSAAFSMQGSTTVNLASSASTAVVGGWEMTGSSRLLEYPSGVAKPPVRVPTFMDPLGHVAAPSTAGLPVRGMTRTYYDSNTPPAGGRIRPGIYCGGLTVSSTAGNTFVMEPGVFVMAGGGFAFTSQASVSGTGVTIYNTTGGASGVSGCTSAFQPFRIDGQAKVTLSAPTSGRLQGIVMFEDRNVTGAGESVITGNSETRIDGAVYLRNSPLSFSGSNSAGGYLILVADKITITGNSNVTANYAALENGSPIRERSVLAE